MIMLKCLTIVQFKKSGKYKVYLTGRSSSHSQEWYGNGGLKIVIDGQPKNGFNTLDNLFDFLNKEIEFCRKNKSFLEAYHGLEGSYFDLGTDLRYPRIEIIHNISIDKIYDININPKSFEDNNINL